MLKPASSSAAITQRIALDNQAALATRHASAAMPRVELYRALGGWQGGEAVATTGRSGAGAAHP